LAIAVTGDAQLFASFNKHADDLGAALQATVALKDPIAAVVAQGASTFASVSVAGGECIVAQASLVSSIQVNIQVSVSASATVQGQG
jgi:hypothetical protein